MSFDVLPSQKGKLPDEPDWERLFGIEIEYNPNGHSTLLYRLALHDRGIDLFDDNCEFLYRTREDYHRGPLRFREPLSCSQTTGSVCPGRHRHLSDIIGHGNRGIAPYMPSGIEASLQEAHSDWRELSLPDILSASHTHPILFDRVLLQHFPPESSSQRRYWNLGTDPTAGFELRTIPLEGREGWSAIEDACTAISEAGGEVNDNCGGHIHMDMTQEDASLTGRLLAVYRMVEPLLAAPVNPSRYYERAYNHTAWSENRFPLASDIKDLLVNKELSADWSSRWLSTSQLRSHGSFEFRGLEGTLDPDTFKNYGLLLNRFIQATKLSGPWGVRLKSLVPIGVGADSIRALFKYLDITRKDIAPELKDVREWYLDRVSEYKEREAFQEYLVVGAGRVGRNTSGHASLKELRKTGKHKNIEAFMDPPKPEDAMSNKERGIFIHSIIDRLISVSIPNRYNNTLSTNNIRGLFIKTPEYCGLVDPEVLWEHDDRARETYLWINSTGDGREAAVITEFWNHLQAFEFEEVGSWYTEHILDRDYNVRAPRLKGFVAIIGSWLSMWSDRHPSETQIIDAFTTGDLSCVDF